MAGQVLETGSRGISQEANTVKFSGSWLPSHFYLPIKPFFVSEAPRALLKWLKLC